MQMTEGDADFALFPPGTMLPTRRETLTHAGAGRSMRDLVEALFDRDLIRANHLLASDRDLARTRIGEGGDAMAVAVATGSIEAIDLLLAYGAAPAGLDGAALDLALVALDLRFARRLLEMGAWQRLRDDPVGPLVTAIAVNSADAVKLLLDYGADANAARSDGAGPLLMALYMETFRIAELLLDRGANAWAIDATGGNLGTAATEAMRTDDPVEAAAQRRLAQRALALGWPNPAPTPAAICARVLAGSWPPAESDAPPVAPGVRAAIATRLRGTGAALH